MKKENKETCENCYFEGGIDCPVPFEMQGQLSAQGEFWCPFWIEKEKNKMKEKIVEGELRDFTDEKEQTKQYKNKVIFLRKSKAGNHLYAFDNDGAFADAKEGSIVMNIAEVRGLISGNLEFIKISVLPPKKKEIDTNVPEI